jgi:hypothetical protein
VGVEGVWPMGAEEWREVDKMGWDGGVGSGEESRGLVGRSLRLPVFWYGWD